MTSRSILTFQCPTCQRTFQVPESVIPPEGTRGKCRGCGTSLNIYLDGRAELLAGSASLGSAASQTPTAPPGPDPNQERLWYLRLNQPKDLLGPGPYTSPELGEMILREEAVEEDVARVGDGPWLPLRSYPALETYWAERTRRHRELHGDDEHCAIHREREPGWICPKCKNYLCEDCVMNKPYIEGGAPRFVCAACDFDVQAVPRKPGAVKKAIPTLFRKP